MGSEQLLNFWKRHSMRTPNLIMALAAVASLIVSELSGDSRLMVVGNVIALIGIFHFFIHGYFYNQYRFLSNYSLRYSLPQKKIRKIGSLYFGGFLMAVGVGVAVIHELYSGTLLAKLKAMIFYVLEKLFGQIFDSDGLGRDEFIIQQKDSLLGTMNQIAKKPESPFEQLIETVQSILIVVGIVMILAVLVTAIIASIRRKIQGVRVDHESDGPVELADSEESLGKRSEQRDHPLDFSPTARIRKIYRKTINHHRRRGQRILDWMTPKEAEQFVGVPEDQPHQELHAMYQKARYSETGCSEEDLRRIRSLKLRRDSAVR